MKSSTKTLFVLLAIVMCFVTVQSVCAVYTFPVTGTIYSISPATNEVTVNDDATGGLTVVSCVRIDYLLNNYDLELAEGDYVNFLVYERTCTGGIKLVAINLTTDDGANYPLRDENTLKPVH